jgi:serine phosphatase RsbU (regulator of sigma subunit)
MGRQSLVLIEDDAGDRLLVTDMLAGVDPDMELTCFTTLRAALESWPADAECVLLDLGLPDAMGLSAVEQLRAAVPDVPIVVLTGRPDDGIGRGALAAGAQDYLVKGKVDGTAIERSVRYAVERRNFTAVELIAQENARLQRGLLPSPLVSTSELRFATFYRPGGGRALLGGDFYDVVQTATGVHLLIGDVSGHGPEEAALGVALRIAWRALVLAGHPGVEVVRGVEQVLLAERHDDEHYATIAMVSVDEASSRADVLLCGHPSPLLVRGHDVDELDESRLPVLTLLEGQPLEPFTVKLDGDWGLLLFTDGMFEGRATPGARARFGVEGLVQELRSLVTADTARDGLASQLFAAVEQANGGPLADDVAALLVGTTGWWS